jgi:hypothetical protein
VQVPDLINGSFEIFGGFILLINVFKMYKDRCLKGVHWGPVVFFTAWGFWNLFYYPHLDQWLSFVGGLFIVSVNFVWLIMTMYFLRRTNDS